MDATILDENGDTINQLAATAPHEVDPLLAAYFKVAYDRDPAFRAIIEDFIASVKRAYAEAGIEKPDA